MAGPIEPTPVLEGEDAERLLRDLANVCSPEEATRRIAWAKRLLVDLERSKERDERAATDP